MVQDHYAQISASGGADSEAHKTKKDSHAAAIKTSVKKGFKDKRRSA